MMNGREYILEHQKEVLLYLRTRFPMYHLSNFFFRDVHYGIRIFLEEKGMKLGYTESEDIARRYVEELEKAGIFAPIDRQSWVVRYPEFKTPPAKPAAQSGPASPSSATGTAAGTSGTASAAKVPGAVQQPGGDAPAPASGQSKS